MNVYDRRQFLSRAALGGATVVSTSALGGMLLPGTADAARDAAGTVVAALKPGERDPNFVEGKVLAIDGSVLVVSSADRLIQRVRVTNGTSVWKARETTLDQLRVDDRLYARGVTDASGTFLAESVWANIVNLHAVLLEVGSDRLRFDHGGTEWVGHLQHDTVVRYDMKPATRDLSGLHAGHHVNLLGAWRPDTNEIDLSTIFA